MRGQRLPGVSRQLLWAAAFIAASLLSRNSLVSPGTDTFGPAVGVAFLWLASGDPRSWRVDVPLLAFLALLVPIVSGDGPLAAALGLVLLLPAPAVLLGLRLRRPQLWGSGGRQPLSRPSDFGLLLLLVVTSATLFATLRTGLGVWLLDETWQSMWLRAGRATASLVAFGTFGLLVGGTLARWSDSTRPMTLWSVGRATEFVAVSALTTASMWFSFVRFPGVPTLFVMILGVVWVSLRFTPVTSAGFALGVSGVTIAFTAESYGPLAELGWVSGRALVTQFFVVVMTVTAMVVSLSRELLSQTVERLTLSEARAARVRDELDLMLEHLTDGVAIIEQGGRFLHTNSALRQLFPQTAPPPGGGDAYVKPATEYHLFHLDGRPLGEDDLPYLRALKGEPIERQDFYLVSTGDQPRRTVEIGAVALPPAPDRVPRVMVTVRDVTAEREHREDLTGFAGTVAHDLNNPLTVLSGWADALQEEFQGAEVVSRQTAEPMLASIQSSAERMRGLITDLLGNAVAADRNLRCETVDLHELVTKLAAARTGPMTVEARIEVGDLPEVWGDEPLLSQVFDNLIGNALKYVDEGTTPLVQVSAEPPQDGWVTVRVRDNGIGVPADQRELIFEQFHRGGGVGYGGTGLGLAICKRIVERHGGRIWVSEAPAGGGSVFALILPTSSAAHRPA